MRKAFIQTLIEIAQADPRVIFITADLGFRVVEPFQERFPERFINAGVAEENMIGIATGLAEAGFIPVVYSITNFSVMRPYEFIRNGPVLHQLPVRIVGIGGGFEYSNNGASHYGLEDIGILRVQPGIAIIAPADAGQVPEAFKASWGYPGPVYYRLSKDDVEVVPGLNGRFDLRQPTAIGDGRDVALVTLGNIAIEAVQAAQVLRRDYGVHATVQVAGCLAPVDQDAWMRCLEPYPHIFTIEAHYTCGGVGSLVSEIVAECGLGCKVTRCGVKTIPDGRSGSRNYLYEKHGISSAAIVRTVLDELSNAKTKN